MASDLLKRLKPLIEAGLDLTKMTPARAEALVRDLVKQGEVHRKEASSLVQALVDRGRQATEKMTDHVRREVAGHVDPLEVRVAALEAQVAELTKRVPALPSDETLTQPVSPKKAPVKPAAGKTAAVKPAPGKTAAVKPAAVKPAAVKKAPAKTAAVQPAAVKKAPAKKAAAKKRTA